MGILRDIGLWLWRLLPGNPILLRVVSAAGKRSRHLWARLVYLLALMTVFLITGGLLLGGGDQSLADLAKKATQTFTAVSIVQLFLMSFVAPVFCAGAITQEKDSNTYHILLTTPMSGAQIVLGSLFSRLFFVWALLLSGLPIFCITMLYGGVTTREIFESFGLAACTGLVTGSIAIMISFTKIGTRRTIFAFFVGVAVYLLGVGALGVSPVGQLAEAPTPIQATVTSSVQKMSWLAPVHPFLSLMVVTGQTPAPLPADVYKYGWPQWWLLAYPQFGYMWLTTIASVLMIMICLFNVRRGAKEGEHTWWTRLTSKLMPAQVTNERRRKPRRVWSNPIAWREASTRASAGGRSMMRLLFIIGGLIAGLVLAISHHNGSFGLGKSEDTRLWLTYAVWIELAVVLLVVTNTAATTLTREKESLTMELLLSTPLTSRYIIAGMLQGLVRLVVPLIAVPTATIFFFVIGDFLNGYRNPVTTVEAGVLVPLLMVSFAALAAIIGLHFSLLSKKTVQAVMISTTIVLGSAGLLWACGYGLSESSSAVAAVILPFTPFPAMQALLDPWLVVELSQDSYNTGAVSVTELQTFRVTRLVFSLIAAAGFLGITYVVYRNMVQGFDMTVRKQSV
jgi:ABC-type transport system involved in multi-copper enzyme maturation permease subunit